MLRVPVAELSRVSRRARTLAFDVYGDDPIPFRLTTVDPETAARYFPDALDRAR